MKTSEDPPRFAEQGPEPLHELVRSARQRGPSDAAADRISKRLAMAGFPTASTSSAKGAPRVERKIAYYKLSLLALAVAGGLALSWRATRVQPSMVDTVPASSLDALPVVLQPATTRPSESIASEQLARPKTAAITVDDLPSAAPPAARASGVASTATGVGTRRAKTSTASPDSAPSSTELETVQRAQAALASDPRRALSITDEHARAYPSGELVQEREVIAVEALSRMGRHEEALRRALSLIQRFPRTPYAARLELAIGRPLPSASSSAEAVTPKGPASAHVNPSP